MSETPAVELAKQLIRLESTPESQGEHQVAELVAGRLEAAGFETILQTYGDGRTNVVARWGRTDRPAVCLSGHLDTVSVVEEEWQVDPYGAEVVGSRLYGRGAVDMKAGVAAIVCAAVQYVSSSPLDERPIALLLTAEEEVGSLGASALAGQPEFLPESRVLLIAEPTSNRPVLGHRGAVWLNLVAHGRSCHASTPQLGENAIDKLVDALRLVRHWCEDNPASHEVLGARTLNVGRIGGGVLRNVVPDRAVAELDFRIPLEDERGGLPQALAALLEDRVEVEEVLTLSPVYTEPGDPMVRIAREVAGCHIELAGGPAVARFFTDASVLTAALGSVPTVICGPGSPDQAHVVDEWCEVAEISTASAIYLDFLHAFTESPVA